MLEDFRLGAQRPSVVQETREEVVDPSPGIQDLVHEEFPSQKLRLKEERGVRA